MQKEKFVYWEDGNFGLGYLEEYPAYVTQGKTLEELKINLADIFRTARFAQDARNARKDTTSGSYPFPVGHPDRE